jgi:hypothetical protein
MDTFEGIISIDEILRTPYPLFYDVLLKQLERKKKKLERLKQNRDTLVSTTYSAGDFR